MDDFMKRLFIDLKGRGRAEGTIENYKKNVSKFLRYIGKAPELITADEVRQYQITLIDRGLDPQTVNINSASLRFFFLTTLGNNWPSNFVPNMKKKRKLPKVLSQDEVVALINATDNLKHKTIFMAMYAGGLRVSEAIKLKTSAIDSKRMIFTVVGKGGKERNVMLSPALLDAFRRYWVARKNEDKRIFLFPSPGGGAGYSSTSARRGFREAKERAGIKKPGGSHLMRHSFATHLMEMGVELRVIQLLLGHALISSTTIYTHLRQDYLGTMKSPLDIIASQIKWR